MTEHPTRRRIERTSLTSQGGRHTMLWTIAVILVVLWFLGLVTAHAFGGLLHLLLVVALIVVVVNLVQGRRASA
jgi:hypothetical protein